MSSRILTILKNQKKKRINQILKGIKKTILVYALQILLDILDILEYIKYY